MRGLTSLYRGTVRALAVVAGAVLVAITLAIALDVGLRACCTSAIRGLTDLVEHGIAAATFLAAPWVLMKNAHVAVDLVVTLLPGGPRRLVDRVVNGVGAAVSAVFFWYLLQALLGALQRGSMVRGILVVPEWLTFAAPVACTLLLAIGFLLRIGAAPEPRSAPGL
ncbi:TRAP transporter small permease [Aquibium sp. A9E412]|uniref:TRAP transporter small permease n=1 Tax=Aquibium sp. A9E412 TaxID=2976767 RepID=UPI0025B01516|nr:TRAP transporter small permease [Aquibium sp. A9E412]MDN2568544.1 TRAP transporter small permease [Aquibium sp. A9E412]